MSTEHLLMALLWSAVTIALYLLAKRLYRRWPRWWTTPLAVTPALLAAIIVLLHQSYRAYIADTHWLVLLLGPATVAFAIPIYQHRALIRTSWRPLLAGVAVGTAASIASSWFLASALGLDAALRLSLVPRSISTPFAMSVATAIGGLPDLTAVFVVFTGVFGAAIGDVLLGLFPLRSALARGTLLGVGAHGAGVAKAHELGHGEGSVAGLMLVLIGVTNVFLAPLLVHVLQRSAG
jgi:predicted murein hydrolase (TIGR00659 family)